MYCLLQSHQMVTCQTKTRITEFNSYQECHGLGRASFSLYSHIWHLIHQLEISYHCSHWNMILEFENILLTSLMTCPSIEIYMPKDRCHFYVVEALCSSLQCFRCIWTCLLPLLQERCKLCWSLRARDKGDEAFTCECLSVSHRTHA